MFYAKIAKQLISDRRLANKMLAEMELGDAYIFRSSEEDGMDAINRGYYDSRWEMGSLQFVEVIPERRISV